MQNVDNLLSITVLCALCVCNHHATSSFDYCILSIVSFCAAHVSNQSRVEIKTTFTSQLRLSCQ